MKSPLKMLTVCAVSLSLLASPIVSATAASLAPVLEDYVNQDWSESQWALKAVQAPQAWNVATGDGVKVAVIDTGIDSTHPDLIDNTVDGYEFQNIEGSWEPVAIPKAEAVDFYGHGTHVAGIIAATGGNNKGITGMAPNAKLMPINILTMLEEEASQITVNNGLRDAINLAVASEAQVINLSIGGASFEKDNQTVVSPLDEAYIASETGVCTAITNAKAAGVITVVAAGNEGSNGNYLSSPAYCDDAVSVAATDSSNNKAYFSNFDETVDIAAPGVDVLSTLSRKASRYFRYGQMSGTSMASPMVAGAMADLKEAFPSDSADQLINRLYNTAVDEGTNGKDAYYGHGIIDLAAAVGAIETRSKMPNTEDLVSTIREAVNSDYESYTVSWNQPLGASLPESYTLTVFDRYGALHSSVTVAGNKVRSLVELPTHFKRSFWVALEANYSDHVVKAAPVFHNDIPVNLDNFALTPNDGGVFPSGAVMSWDAISSLEADGVSYGFFSTNLNSYSQGGTFLPDANGDIATSSEMTFSDPALWMENTTYGDFDIIGYATPYISNGNYGNYGATAFGVIPARNPMGVYGNFVVKGKLASQVVLNASKNGISCGQASGGDCTKAKFQYRYVVTNKVKGKLVNTTYTQTVKNPILYSEEYFTNANIFSITHDTPFKITSATKNVTMKISVINANGKVGAVVLPSRYVYKNFAPINIGTPPTQ